MSPDDTPPLAEPWFAIADSLAAASMEAELRREVHAGHVLARIGAVAVARRSDNDDVLYRLEDGRWAVVHLIWGRARESDPRWPSAEFYASADDLGTRLLQDARDFDVT